MKLTPASTTARSRAIAPSRSGYSPHTCLPVSCIAPKPIRPTTRSPPMVMMLDMVPHSSFAGRDRHALPQPFHAYLFGGAHLPAGHPLSRCSLGDPGATKATPTPPPWPLLIGNLLWALHFAPPDVSRQRSGRMPAPFQSPARP